MNFKFIGGILLIIGTSIGGGMLALPITTAQRGFLGSVLLLFSAWLFMTAGAFLILEVNLWLPADSNLVSMAKETLGRGGALFAWVIYLLLLYCLIAAYISGGSDLLHSLLQLVKLNSPQWLDAIIFTLIFGFIVY